MASGFGDIITQLERQRAGIERALSALRELDGGAAPRRGPGRPPAVKKTAKRKGGITPEGRKRLAAAMKRRWAIKRTASQAKKARHTKKAA